MLVLSRKPGETIYIDDETIKVKIVSIEGNRVRLGIEAPTSVRVRRSEVPPNNPQSQQDTDEDQRPRLAS